MRLPDISLLGTTLLKFYIVKSFSGQEIRFYKTVKYLGLAVTHMCVLMPVLCLVLKMFLQLNFDPLKWPEV